MPKEATCTLQTAQIVVYLKCRVSPACRRGKGHGASWFWDALSFQPRGGLFMNKLTPSKQDYLEAILDLSVQGNRPPPGGRFPSPAALWGDHPHRPGPPGGHKGSSPPRPAEILPDPYSTGAGGDRRGGRLPDGACGQLHHSGTDRSRRHPAYEGVSRRQVAMCCPPVYPVSSVFPSLF